MSKGQTHFTVTKLSLLTCNRPDGYTNDTFAGGELV